MKAQYAPHKVEKHQLKALQNNVLVSDMVFDERISTGGIVLLNDNGKGNGIRPRWGRVYAVGPEQKDVNVGDWVLVAHGRWTRGLDLEDESGQLTIRKIDPKDILLVSDDEECPTVEGISSAVHVDKKEMPN
jgi:co-chaperonin GroES (HSP10)